MPDSPGSSSASASCRRAEVPEARLAWRPSAWLSACLAVLTVLAVFSVLASEMPRWPASGLCLLVLGHGGWLLRREWRGPRTELIFRSGRLTVDGVGVAQAGVQWRGPLVFVSWRDGAGHVRRLSWWPDTLPAACRRELRLAGPLAAAARGRGSMAP